MENVGNFYSVFRNSIGDPNPPNTSVWVKKDIEGSNLPQIMIFICWAFWLINKFYMLIILLNFLIAIIGQSYDSVLGRLTIVRTLQKCEMNIEKMIFIEDESNPLNGRPEEQHKKHGYVWRHMWLAENDSRDRNILNGIVKTMQNHVTELYKTQ